MPLRSKTSVPATVQVVEEPVVTKKPATKRQKTSSTTEKEVDIAPVQVVVSSKEKTEKTEKTGKAGKPGKAEATSLPLNESSVVVEGEPSLKPKASRGKKVGKAVPVVDSLNQDTEPANADTPAIVTTPETKLSELTESFLQKMNDVCHSITYLKKDFQSLEKTFSKELKAVHKSTKRKRRENHQRQPSGFIKPTRISDELAVFLGKPLGSEMARTEVTKALANYIDANNLKDSLNGRIIHADRKLLDLLHIESDTHLTFFNLQKYMRSHFATAASLAAEAAAAAAAGGDVVAV